MQAFFGAPRLASAQQFGRNLRLHPSLGCLILAFLGLQPAWAEPQSAAQAATQANGENPQRITKRSLRLDTGLGQDLSRSNLVLPGNTAELPNPGQRPVASAGGLGQLGDLVVRAGEHLVLSTGPAIPTVFGPDLMTGPVDAAGRPTQDPAQIAAYHVRAMPWAADDASSAYSTKSANTFGGSQTITSGVFQFASLVIEPGAVVDVVGDNPLRLLVRGFADISGVLKIDGEEAPKHLSNEGFGGAGGANAPGSGRGGDGGDRPDMTGTQLVSTNPNSTLKGFQHQPGAVIDTKGQTGQGRGGNQVPMAAEFGAGSGGVQWPAVYPGPLLTDLGGFIPNNICTSAQSGAPGAGGSYSFPGTAGIWAAPTPVVGVPPAPPVALPGQNLLSAAAANLNPDMGGQLLGGAGGGGGGTGLALAKTNGIIFQCQNVAAGQTLKLMDYFDHSGAGGGSGGGAAQIQVGRRLHLSGLIDVSGGAGGSAGPSNPLAYTQFAAPGGGGSGGALLVQAASVRLPGGQVHFDISGGVGGFSTVVGATYRGGDGGPGIVQLETSVLAPLNPAEVASVIQVAPAGGSLPGLQQGDFLKLGQFSPPDAGGVYASCWMETGGQAVADGVSAEGELIPGWNLTLDLGPGLGIVALRGHSGAITDSLGVDLATLFGNQLGQSPLVVRFQGVRQTGRLQDPCGQDPFFGVDAGLAADSLTPWLESPAAVHEFWAETMPLDPDLAASRRPNLMRVQIALDGSAAGAEFVRSLVELTF